MPKTKHKLIALFTLFTILVWIGLQFTPLLTPVSQPVLTEPDVPPLKDTYHPDAQAVDFDGFALSAPVEAVITPAPPDAAADDTPAPPVPDPQRASLYQQITDLDTQLHDGSTARDKWLAAKGPKNKWSKADKATLAAGNAKEVELQTQRQELVEHYNAEAAETATDSLPQHID